MAATIRFQQLVARSGKPDVYTPWSDPLKDRAFQKARKENRVLTVHQNLRGAKDYGEVGFREGRGLQFLLFPKSLHWAQEKRVVGIRYDDVAEAKFPTRLPPKIKKQHSATTEREQSRKENQNPKSELPTKVADKIAVANEEPAKPEEPVILDPLTLQLKNILSDLEKKHTTKAKSALQRLVEERVRSGPS